MVNYIIKYETAKLAKNKGFSWGAIFYYNEGSDLRQLDSLVDSNYNNIYDKYSAPTQSLLQKWLRDIHKIIVWVEPNYDFAEEQILLDEWFAVITKGSFSNNKETKPFKTYEQALEEGLLKALQMIK